MKTFRSTTGPLKERPFYEDAEIEQICGEALRQAGLLPTAPEPVRIDRFIEKRFKVVPSYETLPAGVLGLTRFGPAGPQEVVVAEALDREEGRAAERRVRTTLAHEGGHCLLHAHLFALEGANLSLFADVSEPAKPKILCRDGQVGSGYSGQWWEFQANRAMAALLLPRALMMQRLDEFLVASALGLRSFDHDRLDAAARALADTFDVNPVVARLRIEQFFPNTGQLSL